MILGEFSATLTDQFRISLPKKIREQISGIELVLSKGFDGCIFGYQKDIWEKVSEDELNKPVTTEDGRKIRRQLFAAAEVVMFDEQGRFVLSQTLRKYARLEREIVLIGAGDHFEIWEKNIWAEYLKKLN